MKIGFIGLGYMGSAISKTLIKAGYELVVHDIRQEPVNELEKLGAKAASTPKEVASLSECIFSMVLNDEQTEEVVLGKNGVLEGVKGGVIIIMSTVRPSLIQKISQRALEEKDIPVIDAPVSGVPGAAGGTMITMVGGPEDAVNHYRPVLESMAKTVFYCGKVGSGAIAKLTNALIWEVSWNAVAEALEMGAQEGIEKDLLIGIYNQGLAQCWATKNWHWVEEMRSSPDPLALEYKDMGLVIESAKQKGISVPLIELCYALREKVS
ncbi:MAG: NAD(P)-dependent oxidoreductase [Deltaproteobacteria bacterium]|nr:NAD(P)-dependent oxidoreductase [Deltaproteobacteria bacterium]